MAITISLGTAVFVLTGMLIYANHSYDRWVDATVALLCSAFSFFAAYGLMALLGWL